MYCQQFQEFVSLSIFNTKLPQNERKSERAECLRVKAIKCQAEHASPALSFNAVETLMMRTRRLASPIIISLSLMLIRVCKGAAKSFGATLNSRVAVTGGGGRKPFIAWALESESVLIYYCTNTPWSMDCTWLNYSMTCHTCSTPPHRLSV